MPESLPNDIGGEWSEVFNWPLIGIQTTLTPDGKILTYGTDQSGQQGATLIYDVWDPVTNIHYTLPNKTKTDMFCAAAIVIPSTGEVLIIGGDARPMGLPAYMRMGMALSIIDLLEPIDWPQEDPYEASALNWSET